MIQQTLPSDSDKDKRLDVYLSEKLSISRSLAQELIASLCVKVNGCNTVKNYRIHGDEIIEAELPEPQEIEAVAQDIPIEIVYEDEYLLVVNKPQGMVVHPAAGNPDRTLVNALLFHCAGRLSSINGMVRPGIVHRIDKDTAGLLIVAKTDKAHTGLAEQIAVHSFTRKYQAIVMGNLKDDSGKINKPIGRHKTDRKKMTVTWQNSKEAITHYRVIRRYNGFTHVELTLETGRTHQIRVHMASIGHPVAGDSVYGDNKNALKLNGQCLFAYHIGFIHPITGKNMVFEAEKPEFFHNTLEKLNKTSQ
ncbi:MAG: RNA pseudouridine synthase [Clostridiales bacterium GWF2_36_10]|nr:MAG: RNA pseudouridine synthase [Clostridiales bacterium GWF2_36_10]HAN21531.1 RNA pseudouridine synthase [Clostridiales bacterium]